MSGLTKVSSFEQSADPEIFCGMDNFEREDARKFALCIRFQFPKFSKGFTPADFDGFIQQYIGIENVVSLGRLSFPNEWQMQVNSADIRETVIRIGRTKINNRSCWISPLSPLEIRGYIHWIPSVVPNDCLIGVLKDFGEIVFMENQKHHKWSLKIDSDTRYFAMYLKAGQTAEDVPHFIRVNNRFGLITVKGRPPACFHCREVGHRKKECKVYREKLGDYCLRKAGEGSRTRPRGRRHNPDLLAESGASVDDKAKGTEVTTSKSKKKKQKKSAGNASQSSTSTSSEKKSSGTSTVVDADVLAKIDTVTTEMLDTFRAKLNLAFSESLTSFMKDAQSPETMPCDKNLKVENHVGELVKTISNIKVEDNDKEPENQVVEQGKSKKKKKKNKKKVSITGAL